MEALIPLIFLVLCAIVMGIFLPVLFARRFLNVRPSVLVWPGLGAILATIFLVAAVHTYGQSNLGLSVFIVLACLHTVLLFFSLRRNVAVHNPLAAAFAVASIPWLAAIAVSVAFGVAIANAAA